MASGKHSSDEGLDLSNFPWKIILIAIVCIVLIIAGFFGGKKIYSVAVEKKWFAKKENTKVEEVVNIEEKLPTNLYGYKVLGELKIKEKSFSRYILEVPDDFAEKEENVEVEEQKSISDDMEKALAKGLVKLYGNNVNEIGNFCLMGHNDKDNFAILNELNVKDSFSLKTVNNEKKYIITEITTIEPDDLKCLMPNNESREVTLITCANGSNQRLVVKALEESDYLKTQELSSGEDAILDDGENIAENIGE